MKPHLVIPSPSHDPLAAARQAGNDALDRGLDALAVALRDFAEFRRHEAVVYPGVLQLVDSLERSIRASQLAIASLRERGL